ncbi:MAG: carbamate kinase [Actinobacteria bacterium RBG_16_70_17]|nr:MAG: carbamate kinase [Actinobacteria bacterium RBG_16_70_17]
MRAKRAVVAIGGNSLIKDKQHQTVADQYEAMRETTASIADLVAIGWEMAITHGNGPQVGFILRRSELSRHELHEVPLDACGADSQGAIGYALQQNMRNHLLARGLEIPVATVVTQVEVSPDDPAWQNPSKPIGSFMTAEVAAERRAGEGWAVVEDAGRGWRRVAASPEPVAIVEADVVRMLLDAGVIVITVGGGGIPVVRRSDGTLQGVDAVIDKDLASAMLATVIEAGLLVITTAVEKVALGWGTPQQRWVDRLTLSEAKAYLAEGTHFAAGSMAPKIQACINYLEAGGGEVLITDPAHLPAAIRGETGTRVVP